MVVDNCLELKIDTARFSRGETEIGANMDCIPQFGVNIWFTSLVASSGPKAFYMEYHVIGAGGGLERKIS